jgi:hypothetical protein
MEFLYMRAWFKTSVAAALSLLLGTAALSASAASISVAGGNSTTVGGWQISPAPGINLNITGVSSQTLLIQNETATFDGAGPLNVTFKQLSDNAVAMIEFQGASIDNATGADWTGFTFVLSGSASFESLSDVFVPPAGQGYDYENASLTSATTVKYAGTQLSGVVSTWRGTTASDDLLIAADPSTSTADASFALMQAPVISEVRSPLAAWQSLAGLLFVILITVIRPPKPIAVA